MDMNNCYICHQKQYRPGHNRKVFLKYRQERRKEGRGERNIKKINLTSSKSKHSSCLKKILQYETMKQQAREWEKTCIYPTNDLYLECAEKIYNFLYRKTTH